MTEHERIVKAAKAGLVKAHELALPPEAPEVGLRHEFTQHIARLDKTVAAEAQARLEGAEEDAKLRQSVTQLLRTVGVLVPLTLAVVVVFAVVGFIAFDRIGAQADDLQRVGTENRRLILENERAQKTAAIAVKETAVQARRVVRGTCRSQNQISAALRAIIRRGEANLPRLVAEGTITQAQADRGLRDSRRARRELRDDDCARRAAKIPVLEIEP